MGNDYEKKWGLNGGSYAMSASREHGIVLGGQGCEITLSRKVYVWMINQRIYCMI